MIVVNLHQAKAQLSKLIDKAARGEPFIIAKRGKPLVKVTALNSRPRPRRRGFMRGDIEVPDDFDRMGQRLVAALFGVE